MKIRTTATFLILMIGVILPVQVHAGFEAASVPQNRIPWSGYWWPKSSGNLVLGYSTDPSPFEKYDAYVSGFFPDEAMAKGMLTEYDPDAQSWYGRCDAWAAASILKSEPQQAGTLNGIPFAVGDKKGLLTVAISSSYDALFFGRRYRGSSDDPNDIYPGGVEGFHQTLINYIAIQGLPIIMDHDPGPEIWSYPIYRYQMSWTDSGNTRHVTCKVWMANDFVSPDYIGTKEFSETYTYDLVIDGSGNLLDKPGRWTGDSASNHPDFLWFPVSNGKVHPYLDPDVVQTIVQSKNEISDDIFEPNNDQADATDVEDLVKDRFYWASAQDPDWYRVALGEGDYFYAFILSPSDAIDVRVFDASGNEVGSPLYHGSRIDRVPVDAYYYVSVNPQDADTPYYNIEFFVSPSDSLPHLALTNGWETTMTLVGREWYFDQTRMNLFDGHKQLIDQTTLTIPDEDRQSFSVGTLFPSSAGVGATAKLINIDASHAPYGFYSYIHNNKRVNLPLGQKAETSLYLPYVRKRDAHWYTSIALLNTNPVEAANVSMTMFNPAGERLAEHAFTIPPGQNQVGFIDSLGSVPDPTAWVRFSADQKLKGIGLWNYDGGRTDAAIAGIPLLGAQHSARTLYLAHLADNSLWDTDLTIVNPQSVATDVKISAFDIHGNVVASVSMTIPANGCWYGAAQDLLGNSTAGTVAWLKIKGNHDICGFQLFKRGRNSLAALPLLMYSDLQTELRLKMLPENRSAWIGLVLLNPSSVKSDVWAVPCDAEGNNLLGSGYLWYNTPVGLAAQSNAVGFLDKVFPGIPPGTVTLKIYSDVQITGFALYADESKGQLDVLYLD